MYTRYSVTDSSIRCSIIARYNYAAIQCPKTKITLADFPFPLYFVHFKDNPTNRRLCFIKTLLKNSLSMTLIG
jgi:hypothetical protein